MAGILKLRAYLDGVAGRECAYGRLDCATYMADWVVQLGWPDPMPDRRGTYTTEREYIAAVRSEGGFPESCRRRFARIGLCETSNPEEGSVALVSAPVLRSGRAVLAPTGCLVLDRGFVALLDWPRGVVAVKLPLIASWSVARG